MRGMNGHIGRSGLAALALNMACGDDGAGTATATEATGTATTTDDSTTDPATNTSVPTTNGPTGVTTEAVTETSATEAVTDTSATDTSTTEVATDTSTTEVATDTSSSGSESSSETTAPPPECGDGVMDADEACDDGNQVDTDECTNACVLAACGDGLVQDGAEGCDDGNLDDGDGCSATCTLEGCGDGVVQGMEECDDGNDVDTDACTALCKDAACGDGVAQEGVEACDDGNDVDTDACLPTCVLATCGDGLVQDGVEACDDGNAVDGDACLNNCKLAACGDGVLQVGKEECDDGNLMANDGCSATCAKEVMLKPNLLLCGTSQRNVADFIPAGVPLVVVNSCTPDANTQAMIFSRNGVGFNPATIKAYVEGGGRVLTEIFISDEVYNAVFNAGVVEVGFIGSCTDVAPTVVQFTNADPFWSANMFKPITLGESGCGNNSAAYPGLVPLAGWSANEVSIGYRTAGTGRVWVTNFDWQDTNTVGAAYDYTEQLMGYMITGIKPVP